MNCSHCRRELPKPSRGYRPMQGDGGTLFCTVDCMAAYDAKNEAPTLPTEIKTVDDVKRFFKYLVVVDGTSFHPDDDFENYTNKHTGEDAYTPEQAAIRNTLMSQAFDLCGKLNLGEDYIYQLSIEAEKAVIS